MYTLSTLFIAQLGTALPRMNASREVMTKDLNIVRTQSYSVLMTSAVLCREFADQILKLGLTTERRQALHCSPNLSEPRDGSAWIC